MQHPKPTYLNPYQHQSNGSICTHAIAKFDTTEIECGKVLGRGEFGVVKAVSCIAIRRKFTQWNDEDMQDAREFMNDHYLRSPDNEKRYAIKQLRPNIIRQYFDLHRDSQQTHVPDIKSPTFAFNMIESNSNKSDQNELEGRRVKKVMDVLAEEYKILANLSHPNIIRIRGTSNVDPYSSEFFIIMDKLSDTLKNTIYNSWGPCLKRDTVVFGNLIRKISNKRRINFLRLQQYQILTAYDIASAMNYLHCQKIIHHDLKPENVGFDIRGVTKVFDFGFSRYFPYDKQSEDDVFQMTGITGTIRYMSPEVAKGEKYNEKCDVYSFGIMLLEMLTASTPFERMCVSDHRSKVVQGGKRPTIPKYIPLYLSTFIRDCWHPDLVARPNFRTIKEKLNECTLFHDKTVNDMIGTDHTLSRSEVLALESFHSAEQLNTLINQQ